MGIVLQSFTADIQNCLTTFMFPLIPTQILRYLSPPPFTIVFQYDKKTLKVTNKKNPFLKIFIVNPKYLDSAKSFDKQTMYTIAFLLFVDRGNIFFF